MTALPADAPQPDPTCHAYDQVAHLYAQRIYPELYFKPFDREQLDRLSERVGALGPICDLGCGPGQVARYLKDHGAATLGVDLSPAMTVQAAALNPDIAFQVGDMRALTGVADGAWGGLAAFYSLIHLSRPELPGALRELRRALVPGGWLLAAVHLGSETLHRDELWGLPVSLDFYHFTSAELREYLEQAGLTVVEVLERDPYPPDIEYQSRRGYLFAQRPP
ncbi:MAG: methyltransferase domain-containing protein [Anaerolineales bacterium]|nr:methyltransferase domain-containing protein [Anaerolineales bacterium]